MAETINIPGFGPTKKSTALIVGAGLAVVAGIAWYRSRQQNAAAAASAAPASDQTATDQTAADLAAYAAEPSYVGDYSGGAIVGYTGTGAPVYGAGPSVPGAYTTNGAWAQAAEDYLVNTVGGDANTVGNALGKYITGQALTSDQVAIVQQAIAFNGYPPVNGPDGYPPSYRTGTTPPATIPTNIPNASFVQVTKTTTWDDIAKAYNVFGGNGRALYEYNLLPGKHQPQSYAAVQASWPTIKGRPSWEVALPKRGLQVQLPVVGVVTS